MMATQIKRIGYGSQFNNLFILDNKIIKESKTEYGHFKINKEMLFYKHIIDNNIKLSIPKIYEFSINKYTMEYLTNYKPLYIYFTDLSNKNKYKLLDRIYDQLYNLHNSTKIHIDKNRYVQLLITETYTKVLSRYKEIKEIIEKYSYITSVNNIKLESFDKIMNIIQNKVNMYIESLDEYSLSVIHGDCQFNNILYNTTTNDFVFIDPRGYFGDKDLFGMREYDFAKVKFALSGYDVFDNMEINSLQIDNTNLTIHNIFIIEDDNLFKKDDIVSILTISVWLGNAHCFKNNIPKAVFSFYYALYLASLYL